LPLSWVPLSPQRCVCLIFTVLNSYKLSICMDYTDYQSIWTLWIVNPYESYGLSICLFIRTHILQLAYGKNLPPLLLYRNTPTTITNYERTIMTMHLHQTNHNNKGGAHPKQRMVYEEKKIEQTKEEEINRGKVRILNLCWV